tara:strand:+ start:2518 stop:2760 length:243 start_codon:yes stop_codon:yes gene_type:complete
MEKQCMGAIAKKFTWPFFIQIMECASANSVNLMPGDNPESDNVGWRSLIKNIFLVLSPLELGDELELVIEDIGILRKTVV